MVKRLGHVVLKVRDVDRSVAFYREVLGLREFARDPADRMVFFTGGGSHHDLAVLEVGRGAPPAAPCAVGLAHVAFKVGDHLGDLRARGAGVGRDHMHGLAQDMTRAAQAMHQHA